MIRSRGYIICTKKGKENIDKTLHHDDRRRRRKAAICPPSDRFLFANLVEVLGQASGVVREMQHNGVL